MPVTQRVVACYAVDGCDRAGSELAGARTGSRCRGQLVELSHRVRAADRDLLVQRRADDSVHLAPAHVLAIDAPDDSPGRVLELIDAGLDRETVEDPAIVSRSSPASMSSSTRPGLSSGASIARTWAGAR